MSDIDLLLDEENELTFQLSIEGSRPAQAICRLAIDNKNMTLLFESKKSQSGEVEVTIPSLNHILNEGIYDMTLEVIVDDKYFTPLTLKGNFENSIKVTAEAVVRNKKSNVSAIATLVEKPDNKSNVIKEEKKRPSVSVKNSKSLEKKNFTDDQIMKILNALTKK